jgi:DNA-binding Lrp family transcriptional regulator
MTEAARAVSPPITLAPARAHSAASPSASSRAQLTGSSPGAASATSRADGSAPMAARSARLLAAALYPTSAAPDQSRRKCLPSSRKSVVATTRPSGAASTAASSPIPTSVPGRRGSHADNALIRPNSPTEASVCESCPVIMASASRDIRITGLDLYGTVRPRGACPAMPWEDHMVEAYILVQTEVGKAADVASLIGKISGVTQAEDVTGPYDVIVRAQADNVDELGRLVATHIQSVPGITRTLTCPVVHI